MKLIIARSLNLQANITNYEIGHNADDKYMDANLELAEEMLIEAINNYILENATDFLMKNPEKDPPLDDNPQIQAEPNWRHAPGDVSAWADEGYPEADQ